MNKIKYEDIKNDIISVISSNENSKVFKLKNGEYIKIFSEKFLKMLNSNYLNFEQKILDAPLYIKTNYVTKPNATLYYKDECIGYKMYPSLGITLNQDSDSKNLKEKVDLERYRIIHKNLEKIIKKESSIIFPDLCTCDNIIMTKNLKIFLIDYDGMQIGPHTSIMISDTIGQGEDYINNKKYFDNLLFNKNLDKKSLAYLYFLHAFNTKLSSVGMNIPGTNTSVTLAYVFDYINLDDYEAYEVLSKLNDDTQDNEYVGNIIDKITKNYKMELTPAYTPEGYTKRLIRK